MKEETKGDKLRENLGKREGERHTKGTIMRRVKEIKIKRGKQKNIPTRYAERKILRDEKGKDT